MEKEQNSKWGLKIISLVLIIIYSSYYYFTRSYIANIKDYLIMDMSLTATDFSRISAAFSIGYSVAQLGGGYLMDRISIRYLCPFLLLLGSGASYIFIYFPNVHVAEYSRYILGMCFCLGSIGGLKYFSIVWSEKFSFLINLSTVIMSLAAALAASGSVKMLMEFLGWRVFLKFFTTFGVLLACALFYVLKIVQGKETSGDKSMEKKANVPFTVSLTHILNTSGFVYAAIYSITIAATCFLLMDGYGNTLVGAKFINLSLVEKSLPANVNMLGSAAGAIYNMYAGRWSIRTQMLIHSIFSILATITLVFLNPCFKTTLVCFFILGASSCGSAICFSWLQKNLNTKYHGLGFGLLNFLGMFFGCAVIQRISGVILDFVKSRAIASGITPYVGYTYDNILTMFKFMLVLNILSLISALMLTCKDKCKNQ